MKKLLAVLITGFIAGTVSAIDRDAAMIDSATFEAASYEDVDLFLIALRSEIALKTIHEEWAILAALKFGQASSDGGSDTEAWYMGGGLKYYATDFTSASLIANYQSMGSENNLDTFGVELLAKHRFLSAEEILSPFVTVGTAIQSVQWDLRGSGRQEDAVLLVVTVSVGGDFMMRNDLALTYQVGLSQSMAVDGDDQGAYANGWLGSLAMVYYWE